MSSTENPGLGRLSRAEGEVPGVFSPYPDHAQAVRVQFDERVSILVGRFDHAFDGYVVDAIPQGVTSGVVVPREPRELFLADNAVIR